MKTKILLSAGAMVAAASIAACSEPEQPINDAINPNLNQNVETQTPGANSFTEEQARGHIENAGYSQVSALTLTDTGLWQGTAMQNGQSVNVSVDYRGAVATSPSGAPMPTQAETAAAAPAPGVAATAPVQRPMADDDAMSTPAATPATRQMGERG